jgi:hypothetical protein
MCLSAQSPKQGAVESVYTELSGKACKLLSVQEEGANSAQECPGAGGFRLLVLDSDARQSLTLIYPDGHKSPLNFWHTVTRSFSSLGPKAEWRVARSAKGVKPLALIVRVNANEAQDSAAVTSYLAIVKVTAESSCVIARIRPAANANAAARLKADSAAAKPCLKQLE